MADYSSHYLAPQPELWQGRQDSLPGERFFQRIQTCDLNNQALPTESNFAIIGYRSDTGVARNLGRTGASEGPSALKKALANLPCHRADLETLYDLGDIKVGDDLEAGQSALANLIKTSVQHKLRPIVFGGGHDVAWGHFQGLLQAGTNQSIGIINFDAHFDMRPLINDELGSSGTPFLQMAHACEAESLPFHYLCLGVQKAGNTLSLFETARDHHVDMIFAEEFIPLATPALFERVADFCQAHDAIYLTVCLDVFSCAIAPGVSAPQALGLLPWQVIPLLRHIVQSGRVISMDIAELAPCYDQNAMTATLAANLVSELIHHHRFKE